MTIFIVWSMKICLLPRALEYLSRNNFPIWGLKITTRMRKREILPGKVSSLAYAFGLGFPEVISGQFLKSPNGKNRSKNPVSWTYFCPNRQLNQPKPYLAETLTSRNLYDFKICVALLY